MNLEKGQDAGIMSIFIDSKEIVTIEIPLPVYVLPFFSTTQVLDCNGNVSDTILYLQGTTDEISGSFFVRTRKDDCLLLSIAFEKGLLHYSEYPPDANKAFDIGYDFN